MIKIGNKCISSSSCVLILALIIFSTVAIASIWKDSPKALLDEEPQEVDGVWIPTEEDVRYQDSMWTIINQTQLEVDTIKEAIDHIIYKLDRIEYSDGTVDSIRIPINQ